MQKNLEEQVEGIGSLAEPARRALYLFASTQPDAVSREQAADAVGIPLHSAKFHLDKLVDSGLLAVEFRRLTGRSGPGAGRPSKLYRRSDRELSVSLPERRYDLAGHVLADAIRRAGEEEISLEDAVRQAAAAEGQRIAHGDDGTLPEGNEMQRATKVLARHGYEPRMCQDQIVLANCPFHALAEAHTGLVCGLNEALLKSVLHELGCAGMEACLDPEPGMCCVKLRKRG